MYHNYFIESRRVAVSAEMFRERVDAIFFVLRKNKGSEKLFVANKKC